VTLMTLLLVTLCY